MISTASIKLTERAASRTLERYLDALDYISKTTQKTDITPGEREQLGICVNVIDALSPVVKEIMPPTDAPDYTIQELARVLSLKDDRVVRALISNGEFDGAYALNKRARIPRKAVEDYKRRHALNPVKIDPPGKRSKNKSEPYFYKDGDKVV